MRSLSQVYAMLRRKNLREYALLTGCCFFSVLLITAYVCMMKSPTVLNVLPEGGDSRKQVMMIFVLAVMGCGVFTTYASGLFFRHKSRETGIFMVLGTPQKIIKRQMIKELSLISFGSCAAGAILGVPLAWLIWFLFRILLVDTEEMLFIFNGRAYLYALVFSLYVIIMLFVMLSRFIRRTNMIDVLNESRKSEPMKKIPLWYGLLGIILLTGGGLLGYLTPAFCVRILQWYPPEGLTAFAYLPALAGLYMILLHTVVNGWRRGNNRYKHIVTTGMMKFQGRQTVRNMLVIAVLAAGGYFAAFYAPMLRSGAGISYDARPIDYAYRYRADQQMPAEAEIQMLAAEQGVTVTGYVEAGTAVLGVDGWREVETETGLGITYTTEYRELLHSGIFLSESAYYDLTGEQVDMMPGTVMTIYNDDGSGGYMTDKDITAVTNPVTGKVLQVKPEEEVLTYSLLFGSKVLDDGDFADITTGLTDEWREVQVFFNVENAIETYSFARTLFDIIVERSGPEVEQDTYWDPIIKKKSDEKGEAYFMDRENMAAYGFETVDYDKKDSTNFRLSWKYMPQFRVMDKADFTQTTAVYLLLFIFIAIICFTAVIVIAFTRSLTIALTNAQVYHDLRRLGATGEYLLHTVKGQIYKVFFVPVTTGTVIITLFYIMILFFNDGRFTANEMVGFRNCLVVIGVISMSIYVVYRLTLKRVCQMLDIHVVRDVVHL